MKKQTSKTPINWAKNQVQLARELGITRQCVRNWMGEAGCPGATPNGKYDVDAWREWAASTGKESADTPEISKLKARHIELQNQRLQFRLAVLRREYVPALTVQKWGGDLGAAIRKVVTQLHLAAPNLVGLTTAEVESRLKEMEDEILTQLHQLGQNIESWKASDAQPVDHEV